jgi:hypothetical protein
VSSPPNSWRVPKKLPRRLHLSAWGYYRELKLSRTVADLAEAIEYRPRRAE